MTIEQMKARKIELGYTNERLAELSGVPLGTVQKIFAGVTKAPRYDTIQKLESVLGVYSEYAYEAEPQSEVAETTYSYEAVNSAIPKRKKKQKPLQIKPIKIKLGLFEGKYEMPPEELFYNDDISEMFEDSCDDLLEV